jgi:hypothetical protein
MSCLYSSPEVKRTKMKLFLATNSRSVTRICFGVASYAADVVDRRAQQNAFPHPPT